MFVSVCAMARNATDDSYTVYLYTVALEYSPIVSSDDKQLKVSAPYITNLY